MELKGRIDAQEKTLSRLLEWIRAADSKVQIIIALDLAMIGAVVALSPSPDKASWWTLAAIVAGCAMPGLSLFNAVHVVVPQTESVEERMLFRIGPLKLVWLKRRPDKSYQPSSSLLFFGTLAKCTSDKHCELAKAQTEEGYFDDLCAQVHVNARIADVKFSLVKDAALWMFRAIIPWAFVVYYLFKVAER